MPTPGLAFREAVRSDLADIVALEGQAFPVPWKREFFSSEIGEPFRYNRVVRDSRGALAGYLFCSFAAGEIHIHKIAVSEPWRRHGLARQLMTELLAFGTKTEADTIFLEVRPTNEAAIALYKSLGFVEIGRRPRYYGDGEDALVLSVSVPFKHAPGPTISGRVDLA
jgi:ribosomal-protein-alanine N-acetyltransferase